MLHISDIPMVLMNCVFVYSCQYLFCLKLSWIHNPFQTMESRPVVPDRKLLARLVLIREEARNMMGGGMLDERNDRGLTTLPESEVSICLEI